MYDGVIDLGQRNNPRTWMVESVRPGSRVLEVGCATGFMGEFLVRSGGCAHVGIELDPESAARARARGLSVLEGNVEDDAILGRLDGPYDYVLFGDVLEHLVEPGRLIAKLAERLDASGHMLASIPNVAHWSVRLGLLFGRFDYTAGGLLDRNHVRFFTRKSARELFEHSGLRVARMEGVYAFPFRLPLGHGVKRWVAGRLPGLLTWQNLIDAEKR